MRSILLLLACVGLSAPAAAYVQYIERDETETFLAPPEGYYYNEAEDRWYRYDGLTMEPQPPGFTPPAGQGDKFQLLVAQNEERTHKGWRLEIDVRRVGFTPTQLTWRVDSHFANANGSFCPDASPPPDCVRQEVVPAQSFVLPLSSTVLKIFQKNKEILAPVGHHGDAIGHGWFDDHVQDPATADLRAPRIEWTT